MMSLLRNRRLGEELGGRMSGIEYGSSSTNLRGAHVSPRSCVAVCRNGLPHYGVHNSVQIDPAVSCTVRSRPAPPRIPAGACFVKGFPVYSLSYLWYSPQKVIILFLGYLEKSGKLPDFGCPAERPKSVFHSDYRSTRHAFYIIRDCARGSYTSR